MKKKKESNNGFEFCVVCKLNHNQGKKHKYIPNHKKSLEAVLARFRSKLADLRFFLKNPTPLRPDQPSLSRLWCIFCQLDIIELHSFLTGENAIAHLASEEHLKKLKGFLWKYGGGMDKVDFFRITEVDFAKWRKQCTASKNVAAGKESHGPLLGPSNVMRDLRHTIQSYQSHVVVTLAQNARPIRHASLIHLSMGLPNDLHHCFQVQTYLLILPSVDLHS